MKKRASPWSEGEHAAFLRGLKVFGKGHWKEISRHFVHTRTPTQVASHAQKYFIRNSRKEGARRKSIFDRLEATAEGTDENVPPPAPAPAPAPVVEVKETPTAAAGFDVMHAAVSFWTLVASQYQCNLLRVPTRTHEIRKPIPLRDATNVMHALLR
jgi:SHAQKYF class myb-like DNA-binding protein